MKKVFLLSAIMIAMTATSFAQDEGTAYSQGSSTISAGYGFGNIWKRLFKLSSVFSGSGGSYKSSATGPFALTYEYGVSEKISVGLLVSYSQVKGAYTDTDPDDSYVEKLTNFGAILRGNYHFGNSEKFDPYVGLGLGYYNFKYESKYGDGTSTGNVFAIPSAFGFNGQLGAKYFFSPSFGVFAEVGYVAGGIGQVGLTAKF